MGHNFCLALLGSRELTLGQRELVLPQVARWSRLRRETSETGG